MFKFNLMIILFIRFQIRLNFSVEIMSQTTLNIGSVFLFQVIVYTYRYKFLLILFYVLTIQFAEHIFNTNIDKILYFMDILEFLNYW